jgi:AmmeMemoRadiSam system protein B
MSRRVDEEEHSLEMHLPYIYKMLSLYAPPVSCSHCGYTDPTNSKNTAFQSSPSAVPLVPLMIGNTDPSTESRYGSFLAPYLSDPSNHFVISSDFCHWGSRFRYTYYQSADGSATSLRSSSKVSDDWPIHESIKAVDAESMDAVESGSHEVFLKQLKDTGNTVCGRHPIGVFMAAVEKAEMGEKGRFKFLRYERSGLVEDAGDSSVSYCSAFAVL